MKMKPVILLILLLSIAAMMIALRPRPKMTVPPDARAGDLTLAACEYKTKGAAYRADCGTLIVPENCTSTGSRLLALPVKRIHARSASRREPVVYFAGQFTREPMISAAFFLKRERWPSFG